MRPQFALDFTEVSGEHCLTRRRLAARIDLAALPPDARELGAMELGKWYYPAGGRSGAAPRDPLFVPLLLRASDLQ